MIISDNGSQLASKIFRRVFVVMGISNVLSTNYHAQTNEDTERFNRKILGTLCCYVRD